MKKIIIFFIAIFFVSGSPLFAVEKNSTKKEVPMKQSIQIQKKVIMKKATSIPQKATMKVVPQKQVKKIQLTKKESSSVKSVIKPAVKPFEIKSKAPAPAVIAPLVVPEKMIVTYTDSGFSPSFLSVKNGTTVTFKNESARSMWVASNPHPVHTTYSAFDEKTSVDKGGEYSFTFTKSGNWKYHNHLSPGARGEVDVTE